MKDFLLIASHVQRERTFLIMFPKKIKCQNITDGHLHLDDNQCHVIKSKGMNVHTVLPHHIQL
jgi:hypothetical protein